MAGIRIALAEDDSTQRRMLVTLLELLGYEVVCAVSNGAELITYCDSNPADVALLDLDMPLLDGLETAEELSQHGTPVVLITGLPDSDHLVIEMEPIAVRLTKPVTAEDLTQAIQVAVQSKQGDQLR